MKVLSIRCKMCQIVHKRETDFCSTLGCVFADFMAHINLDLSFTKASNGRFTFDNFYS